MFHSTSHTKTIHIGVIAGIVAKRVGIAASKGAEVAKAKVSGIAGIIGAVAKKAAGYGYGYRSYTGSGGW